MLFTKEPSEDIIVERVANAAGISVRTWFRHFAGRDDVLAALPMRKLELITDFVRARPPEESLFEACSEAVAAAHEAETELDMVLLWGIAVHRSPGACAQGHGSLHSP